MIVETKISSCPITIKSIDHANTISRAYYDHGRAAITEAILTSADFCFNPYASNLRLMVAFYLAQRFLLGERNLPTVEEVLELIANTGAITI